MLKLAVQSVKNYMCKITTFTVDSSGRYIQKESLLICQHDQKPENNKIGHD